MLASLLPPKYVYRNGHKLSERALDTGWAGVTWHDVSEEDRSITMNQRSIVDLCVTTLHNAGHGIVSVDSAMVVKA